MAIAFNLHRPMHVTGLGEGPWEIGALPGDDDYRITVAPIGSRFASESYPFESEQRMNAITFWCFGDTAHPADPRVVGGLLEIHRVVCPSAPEVAPEDLLRSANAREHLRLVAEDLCYAVRAGRLRVELRAPPKLAPPRDKPPPLPPPPAPPVESDAWVAFRLIDQDGEPVARRAFSLTLADKEERPGVLSAAGKERFERVKPGACKLIFSDFDVADFSEPKAAPGKRGDGKEPVKSDGGPVHVVQADDTPWGIADKNGFEHFETIWNATANEKLRENRESPDALLEGDQVAIPEKKPKELSLSTGKETTFTVFIAKRQVRIRLHGDDAKPLEKAPYRLSTGGAILKEGDSADGWVEANIPLRGWPDTLRIEWGELDQEGQYAFSAEVRTDVTLGAERKRTAARLHNLGYASATDEEYELAVRAFQVDYGINEVGLDKKGNLRPKTRDALASIYDKDCNATPADES